jgi:hypothetical protein
MIRLAILAAYAQVGFAVLYALLLWPLADHLRHSVLSTNADKDKPDLLCSEHPGKGCLDAAKLVRSTQIQLGLGTLLVAVVIVFAARRMQKGVRSGRTMYIIVSVIGALVGFNASPLSILSIVAAGLGPLRVVSALGAIAGLAAIALLFTPEARAYFPAAVRKGADGRPRGGLFAPRPPAQRKPAPASGLRSNAASRANARLVKDAAAGGRPSGVRASGVRAKGRADEAAVARGAALARSRAKASKSRRTEL